MNKLISLILLFGLLSSFSFAEGAISCSSILSSPHYSAAPFLNSLSAYERDPSLENLQKHLRDAQSHLRSKGVETAIFGEALFIRPSKTSELNLYALKAVKLLKLKIVYKPKDLIESDAHALFDYQPYHNGSTSPRQIVISSLAVFQASPGGHESHEWSHALTNQFLSGASERGSVFNAVFKNGESLEGFDEISAYFSSFSALEQERNMPPTPLKDHSLKSLFSNDIFHLKNYLDTFMNRLPKIRLEAERLPLDLWRQENAYSISNPKTKTKILLSKRSDGRYLVTFKFIIEGGSISIPLKETFFFVTNPLEMLTHSDAAPLLQHLFKNLRKQIVDMIIISWDLNDHIDRIDPVNMDDPELLRDFLRKYFDIIGPHL